MRGNWIWGIPAVAALALFGAALGYPYIWDDETVLAGARAFGWWSPKAWVLREGEYFRPWPMAILGALDGFLGPGGGARAGHALNLLLHALSATLVARLAWTRENGGNAAMAIWAGLLFAAHPVSLEPAVWVSGAFDAWSVCLILGGWLILERIDESPGAVWGAGLLWFLALMSKESSVAPLAAALILGWAWRGSEQKKFALAAFGALLAGALLRWGVAHGVEAFRQALEWRPGNTEIFWAESFKGLARFWEVPRAMRDGEAGDYGSLALMALCGWWIARAWKSSNISPGMALMGAGIAALALGGLIAGIKHIGGEQVFSLRYAYLPLALFAAGAAREWGAKMNNQKMANWFLGAIALASAAAVWQGKTQWKSSFALWSYAYEHAPKMAMPKINLGIEAEKSLNWLAAEKLFEEAEKLAVGGPLGEIATTEKARSLIKQGKFSAGLAALAGKENQWKNQTLMAEAWAGLGQLPNARKEASEALAKMEAGRYCEAAVWRSLCGEAGAWLAVAELGLGNAKEGAASEALAQSRLSKEDWRKFEGLIEKARPVGKRKRLADESRAKEIKAGQEKREGGLR